VCEYNGHSLSDPYTAHFGLSPDSRTASELPDWIDDNKLKLEADCIRGILATVQFRIFCVIAFYPKKKNAEIRILKTVILCQKLGLSH
jgi:hypothetical protein